MTTKNKNSFKINKGLYFIDCDKYVGLLSKDLWNKKIRTNFFIWIFAFLFLAIVINSIWICSVSYWFIDKNSIIEWYESDPDVNGELTWRYNLGSIFINLIFSIFVTVTLLLSIIKCFKTKSFVNISIFPTFFVFLQTIYNIFNLFQYLILNTNIVETFKISWVYLFQFIILFIYPLIWFFVSRNVSLIRRIAFASRINDTQNSFNQFDQFFANGNFEKSSYNKVDDNEIKNEEKFNEFNNTNDAFYLKIQKLTRAQLEELADALSISGYKQMSDNELRRIIANIRNTQENNFNEKEYKTEKDEDSKA